MGDEADTRLVGGVVTEMALTATLEVDSRVDAVVAEERVWVERARAGRIDAFDAIMGRYEGRLLRFLIGLVGDPEVARELCQDTFLSAYRALPRTRGDMRLSAWLHTIALNKARSHHRSRRFRFFVPIEDHDVPDRAPGIPESLADSESVQRTLDRLSKSYREALLLQNTGGLSCREMAAVLGCSEGAVKVRLMRAREAFRKLYNDEVRDR